MGQEPARKANQLPPLLYLLALALVGTDLPLICFVAEDLAEGGNSS